MQAGKTAATGLRTQQQRLDVIAANISNINTTGYKSARADFKDALYTRIVNPANGQSEESNLFRGTGVIVGSTNRDFAGGTIQTTNEKLDFALHGKGFFVVEAPSGQHLYTKSGNFSTSVENGISYLVNAEGNYVLSAQGTRIQLPNDGNVTVSGNGAIFHDGRAFSSVGIVEFANPEGLLAVGSCCFEETDASGAATAGVNTRVEQGSLEGSNVDLGQELTLMMRTQRLFSITGKALQTADEMDGLSNNMR